MSDRLKQWARAATVGGCFATAMTGCTTLTTPFSAQETSAVSSERTLQIADLYAKSGNFANAEKLYAEVLKADPTSEAAHAGLARAAKLQGKPAPERPSTTPEIVAKAPEVQLAAAEVDESALVGAPSVSEETIPTEKPVERTPVAESKTKSESRATELIAAFEAQSKMAEVEAADVEAAEVPEPAAVAKSDENAGSAADPIAAALDDSTVESDPELGRDLGADLIAAMGSSTPAVETPVADVVDESTSGTPVWAMDDQTTFEMPVVAGEPKSEAQATEEEPATVPEVGPAALADADALEREWFNEFFETGPPQDDPELAALAEDEGSVVAAAEATELVKPAEESSEWVASKLASAPELIEGNEEFLKPVPVPSNELDPLWRVGSKEQPRVQADDLASLLQAEQYLLLNAADVEAWKTVDELLTLSDEATKSLTVTTLGQLPEECRAAVSQRMRTVLATDNTDDLKAAAALALGGLGAQAESAVPMLKHIVLTGGEQASHAAGVTLECLGHEVPSVEAGDELAW